MNLKFYRFNSFSGFIGTILTVATIVISSTVVFAKSSTEIAQIAQQTAVQINNKGGSSPGGSGVIVARQGNTYTVLTANHVVCDAIPEREPIVCRDDISYSIRTQGGKEYPLSRVQPLQKSKNDSDLAIVTFESAEEYPVATVGNSDRAATGSQIYVFGYPAYDDRSGAQRDFEFSPGFVTSRPNSRPAGYTLRYNAVTKIGMSGGPVFDSEGRVVGIHGEGETEGELETSGGNPVKIKTGWNAAIPINSFTAQMSQAGLSSSNLKVDNSLTEEKPAQIDNPSEARDYYARGSVRYEQGDYKGAMEDYVQSLKQNPAQNEAFFAYFNRGNIRYERGDFKGAMEDYNAAIKSNPNADIVYHNRAATRIKLGDYQGAIQDWTGALQRGSKDALTYYNRGIAYSRVGNRQAAVGDYTKALQIDPNNAAAYNARGNNRSELGESHEAIADFTQAIKINPGFADAYNNRAIIRVAQGDRTGAIEDLHKAAQLLLDQGKTAQHQQVMENLRLLERSNTSQPASNSQTPANAPRFTFTHVLDYSNCLEDILQISQNPEQFKQQGRKSNCLTDEFRNYENTGLSKSQALELVKAANSYATSPPRTVKIFPPRGLRLRITQMLGFIYEIDAQDEEFKKIANNIKSG